MSAARQEPVAAPTLRPLARFGVAFGWGLRRAVRTRRFTVVWILSALVGAGLGAAIASQRDAAYELWSLLNIGVLGTAIPLIALAWPAAEDNGAARFYETIRTPVA